jgi:CRISPR-associated protein Csb2
VEARETEEGVVMIAFAFTFPANRYHATPWGRHANEADVAWPPEPVRILRALIATWWRKADHKRFPRGLLDDLVDTLANEAPVFHLPEAVHGHARAFMPAPIERRLIFDGFLRFDHGAQMIAAWPGMTLPPQQRELAAHLIERLGYLGRAESWTEGRIADDWDGEINAVPRSPGNPPPQDTAGIDVTVALSPPAWTALRSTLMPDVARMTKSKRMLIEATLPERLSTALSVDTRDWQKAGWSNPPPLTRIVYDRPAIGPLPRIPRSRPRRRDAEQPGYPQVARLVLAGRPQPRIEDAVHIGEVARLALMSGGGLPPSEFSGRDAQGALRDDPAHRHAFFLPEDADNDGLIDHLTIFCRHGFSAEARNRIDGLTKLWLAQGRPDEDGERGRKEWRLALEDIGPAEIFGMESPLLRSARTWTSVTPYLKPWHSKPGFDAIEQAVRELETRNTFPPLVNATAADHSHSGRRAVGFRRIRSRRGLRQPDATGCFLTLTFAEPFCGPLALGFACHYGLGLFEAVD